MRYSPAWLRAIAATVRARVRAEMIDEIKRAASRHLADQGGANLSLRAVARDLGLVSSAVYRYFASRDELLTALIVDAYNSLGAAAETAEAAVDRADLAGRFYVACHAIRGWALTNPHEYALTYGSPVPGYAAPQDTIGPATRVDPVLGAILRRRRDRVGSCAAVTTMAGRRRSRSMSAGPPTPSFPAYRRRHGPRPDRLDRAVRRGQLRSVRPARTTSSTTATPGSTTRCARWRRAVRPAHAPLGWPAW